MSCYPMCSAISGALEVIPRAAAVGGASAASRGGGGGFGGCVGGGGSVAPSRGGGGSVSSGRTNGNGNCRTRRSAAGPLFMSSKSSAGFIVVSSGGGVEGNRATSAPFASRNQRSTNTVADANKHAGHSRQPSSNVKSLSDAGGAALGADAAVRNVDADGLGAEKRGEEAEAEAGADEEAEEEAEEEEGGFFVKQEKHSLRCGCGVCVTLRDLVNKAPAAVGLAPGAAPGDPIFMSQDGGLVVGKGAQKHHVVACRCPNCNTLRYQRETSAAKCVLLDDATLHLLVGEDQCYQRVLNDDKEMERRQRIGKANAGKASWNKGRKHSPETIAKIKAGTAKAMQDPDVRRRMSEAASRTFHSDATKLKIRRTVRDRTHARIDAKLAAQSEALGARRGKVGVCSIGTYARRISAVQAVSFGVWTGLAIAEREAGEKREVQRLRRVVREEKQRTAARAKRVAAEAKAGEKLYVNLRGVPKSEAHRAAISVALKAKWADPAYRSKQEWLARDRRIRGPSLPGARGARPRQSSTPQARSTPQERKRAKLVQEMKDIYTKATAAVKALEKRKLAGLEVDEAMLSKALVAVEETRKVLKSVGTSLETLQGSNQYNAAAEDENEDEDEEYEEGGRIRGEDGAR